MDSDWMEDITTRLADRGVRVFRFEFAYMAGRRPGADGEPGRKRPPDRAPKLQARWLEVLEQLSSDHGLAPSDLVLGGKSMGGRIASMIVDEVGARGLVCLGYPFHPPGKPDNLRTEHLESLRTRSLFVQGERDPFGTRDEVPGYALSNSIHVEWMPDGDHGLKPRKRSGHTLEENLDTCADAIAAFTAESTG